MKPTIGRVVMPTLGRVGLREQGRCDSSKFTKSLRIGSDIAPPDC
jgi:hypothetical protein